MRASWIAVPLVTVLLLSAYGASSANSQNSTWYLATIEDIAVEIGAPEDLLPDQTRLDFVADKVAEIFEVADIKELPSSDHKFRADISYERVSSDQCRFTVRSEFIRPTSFRRRPQVDWVKSDYVRGPCELVGLSEAVDKVFDQALQLMDDRLSAQNQAYATGQANASAIGEVIGCAAGGECAEDSARTGVGGLDSQAGPKECLYDSGCSPTERCLKPNQYGRGVCAKLKAGSDPVRCTFDVDCQPGYSCQKPSGSLYGVCGKG